MSAEVSMFEGAGDRVRLVQEGEGALAVIRLADGVEVGQVQIAEDSEAMIIERLCIETAHRSYGAGSETAWLLVAAARKSGIPLLRAWAHPNLGLSVYFWTRMGFSPRHGEGPEGGIWFERAV